jgi:alpha-1,2-mannosyltransferase
VLTRSYGRPPAVSLIIGAFTAAGLLLRVFQLGKPGFLLGVIQYDDGVLFGDAIRLVHGVIPYRDFDMVQPPGSMLLMAPVAELAKVTGTGWGLGLARILTVCADTACIVLLGLLTRHRGPLTVAIACGIYAVYPGVLVACTTFLLEPWLNLCCLAAGLLIFDGDRFAGGRRLALGGAVLGFAVSVKLWAAVPLLVTGLLLAGKPRRFGALAAGALAGLVVTVLPFLVIAPGQFVSQVITSQFLRSTLPHSLWPRLADMAGVSWVHGLSEAGGIFILVAITVYLAAGYLVMTVTTRRPPPVLDRYALACLAGVIVMFLLPWEYYSHYAGFVGPFAALTLALPMGRPRDQAEQDQPGQDQPGQDRREPWRTVKLATMPVSGLIVAAPLVAAGFLQVGSEVKPQDTPALVAAVDRLVPAGACVLTNDPAFTIVANRFIAVRGDCPAVVDTYGTLLAMTAGRPQSASLQTMSAAEQTFQQWFHQANFVWLDTADHGLPWANSLYNYLGVHFRRVPLPGEAPFLPGESPDTRGGLFQRIRWCPVKFHRSGCPYIARKHPRRTGRA